MLENLVSVITLFFINHEIIEPDQEEMCIYVLHTKLLSLITYTAIFITLSFSINLLETFVFIFTLVSIRNYSGGYHASTPLNCILLSLSISNISIYLLLPLININLYMPLFILIYSLIVLTIYTPVNHPNLIMTRDEMSENKRRLNLLLMIITCFIVINEVYLKVFNINILLLSLFITSTSVVVSKLSRQEVRK